MINLLLHLWNLINDNEIDTLSPWPLWQLKFSTTTKILVYTGMYDNDQVDLDLHQPVKSFSGSHLWHKCFDLCACKVLLLQTHKLWNILPKLQISGWNAHTIQSVCVYTSAKWELFHALVNEAHCLYRFILITQPSRWQYTFWPTSWQKRLKFAKHK